MLKAILTSPRGEIEQTKELPFVIRFPPAIFLDGGLYLFVVIRSPTEAFYRTTHYYLFPRTPVEEEEFTGEFPGYISYLP
ncbi:hypothetical protein [Nostoc sp. 'Lobaria pulmonaria (5183) cyanobiont']|uniref:hypothetical protein n=1 Tax=Nostoc sp. 'Lobaria pulmonaria (5183) cyanobiont' TaxID=1618022 RepID=UPI000CF33CBE|nr:hypothetical protein [Nostoc sp. 'Lobaria pulmonaria (5183) cyanobiont']AVH71579.1 hypothetical protein NLP_2988 [Nostoc sp. 'Lobaria pulmonaria (5183) cyanobiont']